MTFLRLHRIAPFLLLGGGGLYAQAPGKIPLMDKAGVDIGVPAVVDFQVADASGHVTGVDFTTGKVRQELPNANYDPYDAISDDETGAADEHPIAHFELGFTRPLTLILRLRPKVAAMEQGDVIFLVRTTKSRRVHLPVRTFKVGEIRTYRLVLDPMNLGKCRLEPIKP